MENELNSESSMILEAIAFDYYGMKLEEYFMTLNFSP
jgi:hypothetical protein